MLSIPSERLIYSPSSSIIIKLNDDTHWWLTGIDPKGKFVIEAVRVDCANPLMHGRKPNDVNGYLISVLFYLFFAASNLYFYFSAQTDHRSSIYTKFLDIHTVALVFLSNAA